MYYHVLSALYVCACVLHIHYTLCTVTATAFDLFCIAMATNQHFRLHSPIVNATLLYPKTDFLFTGSLERKLLFSHSRYQQHFDLEGESGIVVRGIGTAVTVSKAVTSLAGGGATSPMFGSEGITSLRKQQ